MLFAWKQGNWSVGFLLRFASYHFLYCLWYFWYCLWCLEIFQKQFEGSVIVFEFMMEAKVKVSFPWQAVKTSLTGLRIEVIKILEAAYEDIWPGLWPHWCLYLCVLSGESVSFEDKAVWVNIKQMSLMMSFSWNPGCLSCFFLKNEGRFSCCMMLGCGLMTCQAGPGEC